MVVLAVVVVDGGGGGGGWWWVGGCCGEVWWWVVVVVVAVYETVHARTRHGHARMHARVRQVLHRRRSFARNPDHHRRVHGSGMGFLLVSLGPLLAHARPRTPRPAASWLTEVVVVAVRILGFPSPAYFPLFGSWVWILGLHHLLISPCSDPGYGSLVSITC